MALDLLEPERPEDDVSQVELALTVLEEARERWVAAAESEAHDAVSRCCPYVTLTARQNINALGVVHRLPSILVSITWCQ